jgi:hypothetical protein
MSHLNYLPAEVKDRRLQKVLIKVAITALVIVVSTYSYSVMQVGGLKGDLEDKQGQVSVAKSLEDSIAAENIKLQASLAIVHSIGSNPLPLNQFLGTILLKTPDDIFINDIFTTSDGSGGGRGATSDGRPERPSRPERGERNAPTTDGSVKDQIPTKEEPIIVDPEKPVTDAENGKTPTDGATPTDGSTPTETVPQASGDAYGTPSTVTIRGSAFSLQSISYLAEVFKNEPYVQSVELSPIENYDDGNLNHKIFELVLVLGQGGR